MNNTNGKLANALARNLFAARAASGMSQADVAKAAGTSRATIAQLESGDGNPTLTTLASVAVALDTTVLMLLLDRNEVDAIAMLVAGMDVGRSTDELAQLAPALQAMARLEASSNAGSRGNLAKLGADSVGPRFVASDRKRIGAAIGTAISPGFGTEIGAALNRADELLK